MTDNSIHLGELTGAAAERSGRDPAPPPSRRGPLSDAVLVGLILATSLVAYVWSASLDPNRNRFYDERFSMENVEVALNTGSLRPANGWYPRLSYLPQTAVLAASGAMAKLTGARSLAVINKAGRATPTAYLLSRLVSAGYGLVALWLTWRLGRRLFSRPVALLGTSFMAITPWQIRASVEFKPDALLLMTTLLSMLWLLDTARRPSAGTYVKSGLGVGLALSSKLNGGLISVPLILLTALRRQARHWLWLVLAGATSLAVFLALHPQVGFYWHYFRRIHRFYDRAQSWPTVLSGTLSLLLSWEFHGRVLGGAAILGLALLLGRLLRRREGGTAALEQLMFLSFPIVYAIGLAIGSSRTKNNNLLQLVPFTSLAAGWLVHRSWQWLAERRPALNRPVVRRAVVAAAATLLLPPAVSYVVSLSTVTTVDQANQFLRRRMDQPAELRVVAHEPLPQPLHLAAMELKSLYRTSPRVLDRTDAEVFPASRLSGQKQRYYLRRLVRLDRKSHFAIFKASWLRVRGPSLVVLVHPWQLAGEPATFEMELQPGREPLQRAYWARLPEAVRPLEFVSFQLEPPAGVSVAELKLGLRPMRPLALHEGGTLVTDRLRVQRTGAPLLLHLAQPAPGMATLQVTVWRWLDPMSDSISTGKGKPRQKPPSEVPEEAGISDRPGRGGG